MNIFAEQLVDVLGKHHHELSNLFTWKLDIPPSLVVRLKASLTTEQSATLNTEQIDFIAEKYDLAEEDLRRLRAALLAETIRRMVANRMDVRIAYKLGMVTLDLLLSDDPAIVMHDCEVLVSELRDLPTLGKPSETVRGLMPNGEHDLAHHPYGVAAHALDAEGTVDLDLMLALDGATETFYQGQLWLEVARDTSDRRAQAGYVAHAQRLLDRATNQGREVPPFAQQSEEHAVLMRAIEHTQAEATSMLTA